VLKDLSHHATVPVRVESTLALAGRHEKHINHRLDSRSAHRACCAPSKPSPLLPVPDTMEQQWTYTDSPVASRQTRYAPQTVPSQQNSQRDQNVAVPDRPEAFNTSADLSRSQSLSAQTPSMRRMDYNSDKDGDVPMEDADMYNKPKQAAHPGHSRQLSAQLLQQEESAAARRYSPMNLSPSSPYAASPQQGGYQSYTPQSQSTRQSPTRGNPYMSPPNSYYSPPGKSCVLSTHLTVWTRLI